MKPNKDIPQSYRADPFVVDGRARQVLKHEEPIDLSPVEFDVFYQLVAQKGSVLRRDQFLPWKREDRAEMRNPVDTHIANLRRKVGESVIITAPGGYRLSPSLAVEIVQSPSASELERLLIVALDQLKTHTVVGLQANIQTCQEMLASRPVADAYTYMALAYINLGHVGLCRELPRISIRRARDVIKAAIKWCPPFGGSYALRGLTSLIYDFNWIAARNDFEKALQLSPDNELGHCFLSLLQVAQKEFEEGLWHAQRAAEVDFDSHMTVVTEPWMMLFAGRVDEALSKAEEVVLHRFVQSAPGHIILGHIYLTLGANGKAMDEYRVALSIDRLPEAIASQGYIHGIENRREDALQCMDSLRRAKAEWPLAYLSSYYDALIWAALGERPKALDALERSFDEKCDWLIFLAVEPRWNSLRSEPRFQALMRKVGLGAAASLGAPEF